LRALVLVKPGEVEVQEIEIPQLHSGEVLLRVGYVGFCGGDLNGYRGTFALQEYPNVLGHEIGATIEKVAENVPPKFQPGQTVTVFPYKSCGKCISCLKGYENACVDNRTMGVRRPGAMAPLVKVPWEVLIEASELPLKELALVEPLAVGFHAADRGQVFAKQKVVVTGCGIVGMGALFSSVKCGAEVIAVDIDDEKLELAKQTGAVAGINSLKQDLHKELLKLTNGFGPDCIIEAVGSAATFRAAVDEVSFKGRVVYIGYAKQPVEYDSRMFVQKELDVFGSRNCGKKDFNDAIGALASGGFPMEGVISKVVDLDEAGAVLADWSDNPGRYTKILVDFTEENY
jgi:threonine dehydrogenase-like Zn-dependent dehydrogenase